MKIIAATIAITIFVSLSGCDEKSTGATSLSSSSAIIGDWSYGRLQDSMFDSARYSFHKDGTLNAVGVFHLLGSYYQILYQDGTWKATNDSLTLRIDTLYESRDYGKTFKPMTIENKEAKIGYSIDGNILGLNLPDGEGSIFVLKLKKMQK